MKTKTLFTVTNILLFFFAGIATHFFVMVIFTDAINDFRAFIDYIPLYLTLIVPIYALIALNRIVKVKSDNIKLRKIKNSSIVLLSLSALALVYGFINTFVSFGGNFLVGGPAKYFPLSFMLLDAAFIFVFIYVLIIFRKEKIEKEQGGDVCFKRIIVDVLKHLYLLFALYFLGTFAFAFYAFDLSAKHVLGTLPTYLLFIVPSLFIIASKIVKAETSEGQYSKARFVLGLVGLITSVVLSTWMFIYLALKPNFIVEAMTASFPLTFAISLSIGPILISLLSVIPPLYVVVSHLVKRFSNKKK
jgi:hypothetical protein